MSVNGIGFTNTYHNQTSTEKSASRNQKYNQNGTVGQTKKDIVKQAADFEKQQNIQTESIRINAFQMMRNKTGSVSGIQTASQPFAFQKKTEGAPYASLADENGVIEYNGVKFTIDNENNRLCLGDMSNMDHVIRIPMSTGGCLMVNRSCIGELSRAIGMFSPKDQSRILRALQIDTKIQEVKEEIEEMGDDIGSGNTSVRQDAENGKDTQERSAEEESLLSTP